jgi:hypothetical protein
MIGGLWLGSSCLSFLCITLDYGLVDDILYFHRD